MPDANPKQPIIADQPTAETVEPVSPEVVADDQQTVDAGTASVPQVPADPDEQEPFDEKADDLTQDYLKYREEIETQGASNGLEQRVLERRQQQGGQAGGEQVDPAVMAQQQDAQRNETLPQYTNAERRQFAQFTDEQLQRGASQEEADAYDGPPIGRDSSYRPDIKDPFTRYRAESAARSRYPGGPGAFMKDAGRTVVDAPGAILSGAINAMNETLDLTASADEWISRNMGTVILGFDDPATGEKALIKALGPEEYAKFKDKDPSFGTVGNIPKPDWMNPDSAGGKMIEGISQFLVGFYGAGKLGPMKNWQPATKLGQFGKASVQGAIADFSVFDPYEENLSNLIQEYPTLANPVNEFLAADPEDSEASNRFKRSLEGLGLGTLAEGFFRSVGAIRRGIIAKRQAGEVSKLPALTEKVRPELPDDAFSILGDPSKDLVSYGPIKAEGFEPKNRAPGTKRQTKDVADPSTTIPPNAGKETDDIFINFSRIDTPEDVQSVIDNMVNKLAGAKEEVNAARRGEHRGFKQMEMDAKYVNAWKTLKDRRLGEPLNAEQAIAVRQLWAESASKLTEVAKRAAETQSPADFFMLRKMMATHQMIQTQVIAARTETARALASWRIPAGSGAERFKAMEEMLNQNGGDKLGLDMAVRLAKLADAGMIKEMDDVIAKGAWAKTRDAFLEAWINGLLTNTQTHAVNAMSNTSVLFQQMYERHTAARIAQLLGDEGSVQLGEATAQYFGMIDGFKDALRFAKKTWQTGETGMGMNKLELPRERAITAENFGADGTNLGKAIDVLGSAVNLPGRALSTSDEFFKTIGYRMELHAQALRMATKEVNAGTIPKENLKARIAEIIENPPESIRLDAVDQALYQTFTQAPGTISKSILKLKANYPVANIIFPFVNTPGNLMKYSFERSPMAPLMKQFREDVAAGGARRDMALARMTTGTTIMLMVSDMAMNGQISGNGPSDREQRQALMRTGWKPNSVKMGDEWVAYNRMDPLGMTFGLAANLVEITSNGDYGPEREVEVQKALVASVGAIANSVMSKTYLTGLSDFVEFTSDPERYADYYSNRLGTSVIPAFSGQVRRTVDPYMREANSLVEALMNKTPGLSDGLPLRRDLWGRPISYQSGLGVGYDFLSPIYVSEENREPIDSAILQNEWNITMPQKKMTFNGASIDLEKYPGAYSRFLELSGNELKLQAFDNKGAKDFLNGVVMNQSQYSEAYNIQSDGPEGGKYFFVRKILEQYREAAKRQILEEFPQIADEAEEKRRHRQELRMPVFNQ